MAENSDLKRERRSYVVGLGLAFILTAVPFGLVAWSDFSRVALLTVIGLFAAAQIIVHIRFFLHIDLSKSNRDDLQLILFTSVIILLMVGGTLWIMSDLAHRMS